MTHQIIPTIFNQVVDIPETDPVPPPTGGECLSLKTDQFGWPWMIRDRTVYWDQSGGGADVEIHGNSSGSTGRFVKFAYLPCNDCIRDPPPPGEIIDFPYTQWQQFIILADWTGPFIDGEELFYRYTDQDPTTFDSGIRTHSEDHTPLQVDCTSGQCVPIFCESLTRLPPPTAFGTLVPPPGWSGGIIPSVLAIWPENTAQVEQFNRLVPYPNVRRSRLYGWEHVFVDPWDPWDPFTEVPDGYVAYEVNDPTDAIPLEDLKGTNGDVGIITNNIASKDVDVLDVDDGVARPGRKLILVRFTETPSVIAPYTKITNSVTGADFFVNGRMNFIRTRSALDTPAFNWPYA
jgi:hypothetical protein